MSAMQRLCALGLILPPTPTAHYVSWVVNNRTVYAACQTPKEGSVLKYVG